MRGDGVAARVPACGLTCADRGRLGERGSTGPPVPDWRRETLPRQSAPGWDGAARQSATESSGEGGVMSQS